MTKATPEIEELAAARLAADEDRITGQARRRQSLSLGGAWREFWRHPSPWMISAFLLAAVVARVAVGSGSLWELAIPVALGIGSVAVGWTLVATRKAATHYTPSRCS